MPKFSGEIVLGCSREQAYSEIASIDLYRKIDPNLGNLKRETVFQVERLVRVVTTFEVIGQVEMEYIFLPETFTVLTQRRPPLAPFTFFIGLQIICDREAGSILKWSEEFEVDSENKKREEAILARFTENENAHFERVRQYLNNIEKSDSKGVTIS